MVRRLEVEADDMSSFVQAKADKPWIWIAMDAKSRQVIAFHVGNRSRRSAKRLWAKIPQAYRQQAMFYTNQYVIYAEVIPAAQHRAISKLARQTNHLERFNNTRRQRVSRLVREALSCSKKLANHIGAIKLFICHDNLTRAAAGRGHPACRALSRPGAAPRGGRGRDRFPAGAVAMERRRGSRMLSLRFR
jgi:insertion element IS1 protein InsB